MDKILHEIKKSEERLQTHIEDVEGRLGQCHGSTTRKKKVSPPPEIRVSTEAEGRHLILLRHFIFYFAVFKFYFVLST